MVGNHPDPKGQLIVIGHQSASVPVTTQVLRREKGRASDVSHRSRFFYASLSSETILGTDSLRIVLHYPQTVFLSQCQNRAHIATLTEQMHRHNGFRPRSYRPSDMFHPHIKRPIIHIHQYRSQSQQTDYLGRGHIRKCRYDHLVSGLQSQSHQRDLQCIRTVSAADHMLHSQIIRQMFLELLHLRPLDKSAAAQDLGNRLIHFRFNLLILPPKIYHPEH